MGISLKGIFSDLKGKVGNITIYQSKGKTIVKSHPVPGKITQSPSLVANKQRFKRIHFLMKAVYPFINLGFYDAAGNDRVPFRVALSANLVASRNANDTADLQWLTISDGTRAGALQPAMYIEDSKAIITWGDPTNDAPFHDNDLAIILAINTTTFKTNVLSKQSQRGHHLAVTNLPVRSAQEQIVVFLFFYHATEWATTKNLRNVSKTQLVGIC